MRFSLTCICCLLLSYGISQSLVSSPVLTYTQSAFDSDTCCWRKLSANEKYQEAGDLILAYLSQKKKVDNKHSLYWHAGQVFAMKKQNDLAKKYMRKTYTVFYKWFGGKEGKMWYFYARGTIAFLDRDKNKLATIQKKWNAAYPHALNYLALAALLENWDKLYKEVNRKI